MRVKSYYSSTVPEAIALARQEMGPDALLVTSRPAPPEARHLGEYEVVFADQAPVAAAEPHKATRFEAGLPEPHRSEDHIAAEVAELKKQIDGMRRALTKAAFAPKQWLGPLPGLSEAYAQLTANDVAEDLAREILQAAAAETEGITAGETSPEQPAAWQRALIEQMQSRFLIEPMLGVAESRPRIVALVGPPGAGKTTTLVKLAVNYGLASRRPVLLISADAYRVAAADQLRAYAAILGVGFEMVETVSALAQTIEENRGKELIFIDTAGLGFAELDSCSDLAQFLSTRSDIDRQLVLSASMKPADLTHVIDAYQIFRPQRLLFTRLDETASLGAIFNEAVRTGKPLSFFAAGQRIPEDIEIASHNRLLERILGGRAERSVRAA
ncbi:MAG: hypothetical protein C5B51_23005 [Terriglobia bacterium]|nr:MAG: hypothetical protein C5B51_23005 [Terriglobia bacterium]